MVYLQIYQELYVSIYSCRNIKIKCILYKTAWDIYTVTGTFLLPAD